MAYTPNLSYQSSCTLRRLAWALRIPMTKAMEEIFRFLPKIINSQEVCNACKDKSKCPGCVFKTED